MPYENCKLGDAAHHTHGWGFSVVTEHDTPLVALTYETEAKAKEAHVLMAKVIVGAAVTLGRRPLAERT
jgi:hypothetical protein